MLVQTTCMIIWAHCFENYRITSFCTLEERMLLIIHQGKSLKKLLNWKRIYRRNYWNAKSLFQHQVNDTNASLTILYLSQKFKDLSMSFVYNSSIGAFSLSSGGLHLNDKGLGRLAINLKLKVRKLWYELEPMNDDHDKELLSENTSNFQDQIV